MLCMLGLKLLLRQLPQLPQCNGSYPPVHPNIIMAYYLDLATEDCKLVVRLQMQNTLGIVVIGQLDE